MTRPAHYKKIIDNYSGREKDIFHRFYEYEQCFAFDNEKERGFEIIISISQFLDIPFRNIYFVGSAQFGYSFQKQTDFSSTSSDLDVAVVDTNLFVKYLEIANRYTNNFKDRSSFSRHGSLSPDKVSELFEGYLSRGYFRPDFMPSCYPKNEWNKFFNQLSSKNNDLFKKVTCGIYASIELFNNKQKLTLSKIKRGK